MFFKSTVENKHYHVVLTPDVTKIPPSDDNSTVGVAKDHQHPIESIDPETGEVFLGEVNDHTHYFRLAEQMQDTALPKVDTGDETAKSFLHKFEKAAKNDSKSIEDGAKAAKYYNQEQWEDSVKEGLLNEDRAALMFDQIGPNTDKLIGHFIQNNPDPALYPVETGDEVLADILTTVLKHIWRNSDKDSLTEQVFIDQLVSGRGIFEPVLDFTKDIGGDILVDYVPYNNVLAGPHTRMDMSDCEDMFRVRYLSMNQGEMEFEGKFEEATTKAGHYPLEVLLSTGYEYDKWYKTPGQQWESPAAKHYPDSLNDLEKGRLVFPVIDWYRKVYFKEYLFRGAEGIQPPIRMKRSEAKQLRDAGVPMADRTSFSIEKLSFVANQELERNDTGFEMFPFSVCYGKKTRKGWRGKVIGAIDMQDEINKRSSQMTEVVNRMASYKYYFDGETFDQDEEEKFMKDSAKSGTKHKVRNIENRPVADEGVNFPVEIFNLEQNALQRMDMYFGGVLNVEEAGKLGSRGLMLQERTALKINEIFFKHYENTFIAVNKKLIHYIQRFYPPSKILRIIRSAPLSDDEARYQQMEDQEILKLLSTTDLVKFDFAVGVMKNSPTFKEVQTDILREMMNHGIPIPLSYFVEQSSLPNKRKLLIEMQADQQAQSEAQEKIAGSEMAKTLAAKLPEGSPLILGLLQQSGYDIGAMMQGLQGGGFTQPQNIPPQTAPPGVPAL